MKLRLEIAEAEIRRLSGEYQSICAERDEDPTGIYLTLAEWMAHRIAAKLSHTTSTCGCENSALAELLLPNIEEKLAGRHRAPSKRAA